ncbi:MAG: site-specific integrase [Pseudomonadales bacterium]|nr:site-specific integrase [Pseudomonadales bacterium]
MKRPSKNSDSSTNKPAAPVAPSDRGALRAIAKPILDRYNGLAESTKAEYRQIMLRLDGAHWHDYATARQLRNPSAVRAAWRVFMAYWLSEALRESEHAPTAEARAAARALARNYAAQLMTEEQYVLPQKQRCNSKAKRSSLAGLPSNWRDQLLGAIPSKHQLHCAMMLLTGARPEELGKPIELRVLPDSSLEILIQGAKVSDNTDAGQTWRRLTLRGGLAEQLRQAVVRKGGHITVAPKQGLGLQKAIAAAAQKLGFQSVSAYSLRHAFAADLKAQKADPDAISLALGHVSRASKSRYGSARNGRAGRAILLAVEADRTLRGEVRDPKILFADQPSFVKTKRR